MTTSYTTGNSSSWTVTGIRVEIHRAAPVEPPLPEELVAAIYDACAWLELELPLDNPQVVKAARKRLAKQHHPDAGGDVRLMQQVNAAADFLLQGMK